MLGEWATASPHGCKCEFKRSRANARYTSFLPMVFLLAVCCNVHGLKCFVDVSTYKLYTPLSLNTSISAALLCYHLNAWPHQCNQFGLCGSTQHLGCTNSVRRYSHGLTYAVGKLKKLEKCCLAWTILLIKAVLSKKANICYCHNIKLINHHFFICSLYNWSLGQAR